MDASKYQAGWGGDGFHTFRIYADGRSSTSDKVIYVEEVISILEYIAQAPGAKVLPIKKTIAQLKEYGTWLGELKWTD